MKLKIRKSVPSDITWVNANVVEMWATHARHEPELLDERRLMKGTDPKEYRKWLRSKKTHIRVAEADGKIAGYLLSEVETIPEFFKEKKILYLNEIYVAKEFRKMGVGRALLREAERIARESGIRRMQARVYSFNRPSQHMFGSMGWNVPYMTYDKLLG